MGNDPKHTSKVVAEWLKDDKVKVLEWPSHNPRTFVGRIEKAWRPTNRTRLQQLCQEEWAKGHPIYCGMLVEGYLKRMTQVKLFKGIATKY
jgi:hypothetical protein